MIRGISYKQLGWSILLSITILVTFNLLVNFPIDYVYTTTNLFLFGLLIAVFILKTAQYIREGKASKIYLMLLLFFLVPIYGSIQSFLIYGQPFIYGILTERVKIFGLVGLLMIILLENKSISLSQLKNQVLFWATLLLALLLILNFFVPNSVLIDYDFVIDSISKGFRIKFNQTLIVFLFFYSVIKGRDSKNYILILLALVILVYFAFIYKARSLTVSMLLSLVFYFILNQKAFKNISLLVILSSISVIIFLMVKLIIPEKLDLILELFYSAFNVFLGGEISDASSLSRITQVDIALDGFKNHPLLGNGFLSTRWKDGFQGLYGHFFPSDIGWIGVLYLYGLVGLGIYLIPFIWTLKMSIVLKQNKVKISDHFIMASYYTILYLFFQNVIAGFFVKKVGIVVFFFAIAYYHYYNHMTKAVEK